MTFRVSITAVGGRSIITNIAGCTDAEDAKEKARTLYKVLKFKSVEAVKVKK